MVGILGATSMVNRAMKHTAVTVDPSVWKTRGPMSSKSGRGVSSRRGSAR